ncbi:unnamed protein product [Gongylonema pulchrum]|uniref:ADH_zinc_N domain-containing protein n=1 Tax=Gongylonema pulchrum TaxID=637853 RepID=A0A183EV85_9BILA|nr:unnamed protein product [Gongylonema pulchrum]
MTLLSAKAFGATEVAITDVMDSRLAIAKEIGADLTINVKDKSPDDVISILKDKFGELPETSVECVGFPESVELSIRVRLYSLFVNSLVTSTLHSDFTGHHFFRF